MNIKPIETKYKDYLFRSRLEARWAVFFDYIGTPWNYEIEGYQFNRYKYLPDFYLPNQNCFVEIKGYEPEINYKNMLATFSKSTGKWLDLIIGEPGKQIIIAYKNGVKKSPVFLGECWNCHDLCFFTPPGDWQPTYGEYYIGHCGRCGEEMIKVSINITCSLNLAKQKRFEHSGMNIR